MIQIDRNVTRLLANSSMTFVMLFETCDSEKDDKILEVIFDTIGNHPDKLKYKRLNLQNLRKIFTKPASAVDHYTPNKK